MNTEENLDRMKDKVWRMLLKIKETRNSDKRLIYEILTEYHGFFMTFDEFNDFPPFESIRRMRQKIQADGDFKPTDLEVWIKRGHQEKEYHRYFSRQNTVLSDYAEFK